MCSLMWYYFVLQLQRTYVDSDLCSFSSDFWEIGVKIGIHGQKRWTIGIIGIFRFYGKMGENRQK